MFISVITRLHKKQHGRETDNEYGELHWILLLNLKPTNPPKS